MADYDREQAFFLGLAERLTGQDEVEVAPARGGLLDEAALLRLARAGAGATDELRRIMSTGLAEDDEAPELSPFRM